MSIKELKKDVLEIKKALNTRPIVNTEIQNMTDEELQQAIYEELAKLGFKSKEELQEAAKKYFAESGLNIPFYNEYQFEQVIFEHLDDIVLKYGSFGEVSP